MVKVTKKRTLHQKKTNKSKSKTWLAQSVERQPFKLVVVGSSPTLGVNIK